MDAFISERVISDTALTNSLASIPWLARSIANSLRLDDQQDQQENVDAQTDSDDDDDGSDTPDDASTSDREGEEPPESLEARRRTSRSSIKQSLTRQLWGFVNLLAPPPFSSTPSHSNRTQDAWDREGEEENGAENDEELVVVGVKEEVLNFARNIEMHPETWLDFPLDPKEDLDGFDMSEAQREHFLAIESFVPRLRALRIELFPCHMSESYFWKVVEARALWMQELHKQTKVESDWLGRSIYHMKTDSYTLGEDFPYSPSYMLSGGMPFKSFDFETTKSSTSRYSDSEKCLSLSSEMQITGDSAVEENSAADTRDNDLPPFSLMKIHVQKFADEDDDAWPEDEVSDLVGYNLGIILVGSEEDCLLCVVLVSRNFSRPYELGIIFKSAAVLKECL